MTFEIKTVMKEKFGANSTPTGGKASDFQEDYIGNINKHSVLAKQSFYKGGNEYSLGKKEREILLNILESCEEKNLVGFKLTVGIDNKFNVSNNNKYNQFYIIENLKND
ncbi:hypothetical protein [Proteus genomosp. 4]|uniref:hypothetical protein n=1 Tax=Proteus genomosp. 4 TaxID=1311818 RepID=UPI001FC926EB|nr:hypothetical protein [Proteus genomosp. 4]